jgi:hypothetical protein
MNAPDPRQSLEEAFEQIEETILPTLSMMLDTLLEAASLARPGQDAEVHAAELRTIGYQLQELTRQIEAAAPRPAQVQPPRRASAA